MKKRGLCILLSGMMIFSSAPYGGTKEVNGQVIRDIPNEKDSVYQGLSVVETGAASGEEKEVNRNLFELDELQIKEFEEIGLGFGIIEVTGD